MNNVNFTMDMYRKFDTTCEAFTEKLKNVEKIIEQVKRENYELKTALKVLGNDIQKLKFELENSVSYHLSVKE